MSLNLDPGADFA
jgi:MFS family permease